ncbi:hypothetical protein [Glycomyces paridis]|nr:hypothetical protein [Glycomyces paridis]
MDRIIDHVTAVWTYVMTSPFTTVALVATIAACAVIVLVQRRRP